jgi:rod shape determining protein RodA
MNLVQLLVRLRLIRRPSSAHHGLMDVLHLDRFLLYGLAVLAVFGLFVLYSAEGQSGTMVMHQFLRLVVAFILLSVIAQISPQRLLAWIPWLYLFALFLLVVVMIIGDVGKGAQRWLDLGFLRFQPSEILKLVIPMTVAWYLQRGSLPPSFGKFMIAMSIILGPALLTALQPDLGTAIILLCAGGSVLVLAGLSWRILASVGGLIAFSLPLAWALLHDYQRNRILTFLDPERDPLGAGYHTIQAKIAIGSGGIFGKGWLNGSQAHLNYLPEHATDFIFAVVGEELGLLGCFVLLCIYAFIIFRAWQISIQAKDTFSRLVAGSITITFFLSVFINAGMVVGILPVVGLPLPLVSYGGTAMVINMMNFGILMSIHAHRRLLGD